MYICMVQRTDHPVRLYAFSSAENACDKAMQTAMECRDQAKPGYYEPGKGKIVFHGYGEEPDLFIVCDRKILNDKATVCGVPDFVVEILSYSTRRRDMTTKKDIYE